MKKIIKNTLTLVAVGALSACSQQIIPEAGIPEATGHQQVAHQPGPVHQPANTPNASIPVAQPLPMVHARPGWNQAPRFVPRQSTPPRQSRHELQSIGHKIFINEAGGDKRKLVHWNRGENFAAMGIGHWTWYPQGARRHKFGNSFPGLLGFMEQRGVQLPGWLQTAKHRGAPWPNRSALMRAKNTHQVRELEELLYRTKDIQAEYIIKRAQRAMPKLVKASPSYLRPQVSRNLNAVANTPGGWYALVDYVNFKGEGLNRRGGYRGQNWGLLQVLEHMQPATPGQPALNNFATAAMQVLERRVRNSPPSRGEARWLNGWSNRINTYRSPI